MNDRSVVVRDLVKRFGAFTAVDHVNLETARGEIFGFLGPNGAGKSTTIKMLCGLLRPTAGQISIAGHDAAAQPLEVKRSIGVLLEEANLYDRLTGREFLIFSARMHGLPLPEARSRCDELLELMELTGEQDKLIIDYSMGMKKKTAFAAALIHHPRGLFLDEPFNGIDPVSVRGIRN